MGHGKARAWAWFVLCLLLLLFAAACAPNAPQDTLKPEGPIAQQINRLWWPVFWIAVAIFFIVEGGIVYALVRFRDRPGAVEPPQIHGNTKLEIAWTVAPALLLAGVAIATLATLIDLAKAPEGDVLQVKVTGMQWWWQYEYPQQGVITANELHIPINRPIDLALHSDNVIHSFWVPKLAGKQDVVPGRTNKLLIEAVKPGVYEGQCVEFCGLSHANMRLRVIAHTEEGFNEWISDQKQPARDPAVGSIAAQGHNLFVNGACAGCHTVNGTTAQGKVGPDLTHLFSRTRFAGAVFDLNPNNVARWLKDPPAMKPMLPEKGIGMPNLRLSASEIEALVAYLETLR